jgi:hypothetical protein
MLAQLNPFDFVVLLTLLQYGAERDHRPGHSLVGGLVGAVSLLGVNALLIRHFYRGPSQDRLTDEDKDIP